MNTNTQNLLLGIDWGTSNRRAYLVDRAGHCLARHEDAQGLLATKGNFAASLDALRASMDVAPSIPVIMSGMVGSASGWREVPYLDTSVALDALPRHLARLDGYPGCAIVPGYCDRSHGVDVMRGEETQLLGAAVLGVRDGWMVLPGTHSKWVLVRDGHIARLATYMTGELFAMLAAGGTLAPMMTPMLTPMTAPNLKSDGAQNDDDPGAFAAGLDEALLARPLSNSLFGVRARVVAKDMPAARARSFVSGLLIGAEFVAAGQQAAAGGASLHIIGSAALATRYQHAARQFGVTARVIDPDQAYCAALTRFF